MWDIVIAGSHLLSVQVINHLNNASEVHIIKYGCIELRPDTSAHGRKKTSYTFTASAGHRVRRGVESPKNNVRAPKRFQVGRWRGVKKKARTIHILTDRCFDVLQQLRFQAACLLYHQLRASRDSEALRINSPPSLITISPARTLHKHTSAIWGQTRQFGRDLPKRIRTQWPEAVNNSTFS